MVWRLRFYDTEGVEIGYVEKPDKYAYNVFITHPDSGWDSVKSELNNFERHYPEDPNSGLTSPLGEIDSGPMFFRLPPEKHLQKVQDEFSHPDVARIELNDE
jgi:hypothetical protein